MRPLAVLPTALALLTFSTPGLVAQEFAELCRSILKANVGQWASYKATGGHSDGATVRFAVIGSEQKDGATLYWYEVNTNNPSNPQASAIVQLLVTGLDNVGGARGMVVKQGSRPAMKMPEQMMAMMGSHVPSNAAGLMAERCKQAQTVGWETVTVPAGSIHALHVKDAKGEAWVSPDVPFGLVKTHGANGDELALTGHGTDAKSSITDAP